MENFKKYKRDIVRNLSYRGLEDSYTERAALDSFSKDVDPNIAAKIMVIDKYGDNLMEGEFNECH